MLILEDAPLHATERTARLLSEGNVRLVMVHKNCTSYCQSLDVGVFDQFKAAMKKTISELRWITIIDVAD